MTPVALTKMFFHLYKGQQKWPKANKEAECEKQMVSSGNTSTVP